MRATDVRNAIQIWQNQGFKFVEIRGEELYVGNSKNELRSVGRIDSPNVSARYMISMKPFIIEFYAFTQKFANERFVGAKLLTGGCDCIVRLHDRVRNTIIAYEQNTADTNDYK